MECEPSESKKIIIAEYLKNTTIEVAPKVYAYSTEDIPKLKEYLKIGYTKRENVDDRISEQSGQIPIDLDRRWWDFACFNPSQNDTFTASDWFHDTAFHAYLEKLGIERYTIPKTNEQTREYEWFKITSSKSQELFEDFKENRGYISAGDVTPYKLRTEQEAAVEATRRYYEEHGGKGEFLWNAKPRFGKTLAAYEFCKRIKAEKILILTNRPAVSNSWHDDYKDHIGEGDKYYFVCDRSLKGKKSLMTSDQFLKKYSKSPDAKLIEFISLQDLKGAKDFGGVFEKLSYIKDIKWDLIIIDETHEGVDTEKTSTALENLKYDFALHLSGTPYRQLANNKFPEDAIFSWTYIDEQNAKRNWKGPDNNPYAGFPQLNLFTYKMSDIILDKIDDGCVDETGNKLDYAFNLMEFFRVSKGKFVHEPAVNKFLKSLLTLEKFPFSTPEMRNEIKHSLWLMSRNESVRALKKKLQETEYFDGVKNIFKDEYEIIIAPEEEDKKSAYDKVKEAIANHDKTITLSVRKLTTGVTIRELTAILMLNDTESPAQYMQSAFRAQTPCKFPNGTNKSVFEKQNAYIFDFNPSRTLELFAEFSNKISSRKQSGKTDEEGNVRELLNFFPVIGEDENGEMVKLDAEKVLAIPNQIKISSLFQSGFENRFLFNDVMSLGSTSSEVIDIINKMASYKKNPKQIPNPKQNIGLHPGGFGSGVYGGGDGSSGGVDVDNPDVENPPDKIEKDEKDKYIQNLKERVYGFSRLIPLFLMAYGKDNKINLNNFEAYVPGDVFENVSKITIDEFKQLRDDGELFNTTLFNAAITEFIETRDKLKNYLEQDKDDNVTIFNYIPPQESNMIFTPKGTVKKMVDMLEEENPGCFDDPNKTFIDLYMKSGLYIAEIVKRLYQSQKMIQLFPDKTKRLQHIFEKQVYGLAPTKILYDISTNYILGFDGGGCIKKHNFKLVNHNDLLESVKVGKLQELLDELYE